MSTLTQGLEHRLARGVVAGTAAGLLFLLANMWYADSQGLPAVAPLYDISTIFHFTDMPQPSPENLAIGLIVHLALSAAFGATFAAFAPLLRARGVLVGAGAAFGLLLYVVNFQILGRLAFDWFQEGPNQAFEVFAHLGYGLLLVPFALDLVHEPQPTAAMGRMSAGQARGAQTGR